jgi:hypothetical protein
MWLESRDMGPAKVLRYLMEDTSSIHLLDFTLEAGGSTVGTWNRKKAHKDLLLSLPLLHHIRKETDIQVDAIIIPEGAGNTLDNFLSVAYTGRCRHNGVDRRQVNDIELCVVMLRGKQLLFEIFFSSVLEEWTRPRQRR